MSPPGQSCSSPRCCFFVYFSMTISYARRSAIHWMDLRVCTRCSYAHSTSHAGRAAIRSRIRDRRDVLIRCSSSSFGFLCLIVPHRPLTMVPYGILGRRSYLAHEFALYPSMIAYSDAGDLMPPREVGLWAGCWSKRDVRDLVGGIKSCD